MYLMILEVVLVAILVFVVGPILFVRFNLLDVLSSVWLTLFVAVLEYPPALPRPTSIAESSSFHTRHWASPALRRR